MFLRALEHQVLKEMRDAGLAGLLIGRADAIPDHMRDDRRAAIGDDDKLKPVSEREMSDFVLGFRRALRACRKRRGRESGGDNASKS